MAKRKSETKAATKPAAKDYPKIYFYPPVELLRDLDASKGRQQVSLESVVSPRTGPLSRSSYICSIIEQFLETKRVYDEHSDEGWAGYWAAVLKAVSPKAKSKPRKGRTS